MYLRPWVLTAAASLPLTAIYLTGAGSLSDILFWSEVGCLMYDVGKQISKNSLLLHA